MSAFLLKLTASFWFLLFPFIVEAGPVPDFDQEVSLTAREQPVNSFLMELFGQINVPVTIDSDIQGPVNGAFTDVPASEIFQSISRSFGQLAVYYDGTVAHVYAAKEIVQRMLSGPGQVIKSVIGSAQELKMIDETNKLRPTRAGGLVVTGSKRFVEQIEEMVFAAKSKVLDREPVETFEVFYLKYAWAQDVTMTVSGRQIVVPGVASILRSLIEDGPRLTSQSVSSDTLTRPVQPSVRGQGLGGIGANGKESVPKVGNQPVKDKQSPQDRESLQAQSVRTQEVGEAQRARIDVDPRLNAIIIRDTPAKMRRYKALIETLDVKPEMLEIEATIIDVNTSRLREMGINWRWQDGDNEALFGRGNEGDELLRPNEIITPQGTGGFVSFVLGGHAKFIGRINALEREGAADIVSRPHILTLSNVEAVFNTGETFYVRVEGREEVDLFNISVGTSLRVTPHVFKEDGYSKIKLLIAIEDGQQKGGEVDRIPIIENSTINTQALINAGESILIGGLVREKNEEVEDKVPFLGDIPLLGRLFKRKKRTSSKVERLFLISPRLATSGGASQQGGGASQQDKGQPQGQSRQSFKPFLDSWSPDEKRGNQAQPVETGGDNALQPQEKPTEKPKAKTPRTSWEQLLDY